MDILQDNSIIVTDFKGVYQRADIYDLPTAVAQTCNNFNLTHAGKLVKRSGYKVATLNGIAFVTTGLQGTILALFELITGRDTTTAPNEAVKYFAFTNYGTGQLYVWTESTPTWTRIDGSLSDFRNAAGVVQRCRFQVEDGVLRVLAGNRSVNVMLWYGYLNERFSKAYLDTTQALVPIAAGFPTNAMVASISAVPNSYAATYLYMKPSWAVWNNVIAGTAIAASTYKFLGYAVVAEYDNKQWTLPTSLAGVNMLMMGVGIAYRARVTLTVPATVNRRVTGFKVFRAESDDAQLDFRMPSYAAALGLYRLMSQIDVNEGYSSTVTSLADWNGVPSAWPDKNAYSVTASWATATLRMTITASAGLTADLDLADDLFNGMTMLIYNTATHAVYKGVVADTVAASEASQYFTLAADPGLTNGVTYYIKLINGWSKTGTNYVYTLVDTAPLGALAASPSIFEDLGITQSSYTDICAKYGTMINDMAFYANISHNGYTKSHLVAYGFITANGQVANDTHHILNAFSARFPIKGVSGISDRLIIYGDSSIARGVIPSYNQKSWEFEKEYLNVGLIAERSLVSIHNRDFFLASDWDVKTFDGTIPPESIGDGIYDTLQAAGKASIDYLRNAVGFYVPHLNSYGLQFQTGAATYETWLYEVSGTKGWYRVTWNATFTEYITSRENKLLTATATAVFEQNSNLVDGYGGSTSEYAVGYKSVPIYAGGETLHLTTLAITYKSDSAFSVFLYLDGETTPQTVSVPAQTTYGIAIFDLPVGYTCRSLEFGVEIPTAELKNNTYLEIGELRINYVRISGGKRT